MAVTSQLKKPISIDHNHFIWLTPMTIHYEAATHRNDQTAVEEIQKGNRHWWTNNTMSYDWTSRVGSEKYSLGWYDEIDRRFIESSKLFAHDARPFGKLIPYEAIAGKRVLEIGCGMGLHTELLAKSGAEVSAIDLSDTSVESTKNRLKLKKIEAKVQQADAETIPFADKSFDFVWSWGVIHHSSRTAKIVREISRVLAPEGETRIMVYNRDSASVFRAIMKYQIFRLGFLRGQSTDTALNRGTDGFHARHYTKDQFEDLFRAFFKDVSSEICGQEADALPLPRAIRGIAKMAVSDKWMQNRQARRGSFLFLTAKQPT
jgi:2-polyprenyl-3-methyl-5-hydroxy-6-metoxy-1,4-benzoquinol methylase